MQGSARRHRLLKAMHTEPLQAWMVLAKCATGLAVTVLLAAIGASETLDHNAVGNVAAAVVPRAAQPVQVHRKQMFDERRARFAGGAGWRNLASEAVEPAKRPPPERR